MRGIVAEGVSLADFVAIDEVGGDEVLRRDRLCVAKGERRFLERSADRW